MWIIRVKKKEKLLKIEKENELKRKQNSTKWTIIIPLSNHRTIIILKSHNLIYITFQCHHRLSHKHGRFQSTQPIAAAAGNKPIAFNFLNANAKPINCIPQYINRGVVTSVFLSPKRSKVFPLVSIALIGWNKPLKVTIMLEKILDPVSGEPYHHPVILRAGKRTLREFVRVSYSKLPHLLFVSFLHGRFYFLLFSARIIVTSTTIGRRFCGSAIIKPRGIGVFTRRVFRHRSRQRTRFEVDFE